MQYVITRYPPLTLFTIRWLLPEDVQHERYPAIQNIDATFPVIPAILYSILFYLIWQILYFVFIVYGRREKVISGSRVTSYTWLLNDKNGFVATLIRKYNVGNMNNDSDWRKISFYFFLQFLYMFLSIIPVCLWFYRYKYVFYESRISRIEY